MSQGPPNPWLSSAKVQKRGFSKKALTGLKKLFLFWVCMNPSNLWNTVGSHKDRVKILDLKSDGAKW